MKLTKQEKRILENLGYYSCFGLNYPIDKKRKILKFWIILFVVGIPLLFVHVVVPFIYFFAFIIVLFIGEKKSYIDDQAKIKIYSDKYTREYTLLKKENPGLTVETFAEAVKAFIAAQEKKENEQEIQNLKNDYRL